MFDNKKGRWVDISEYGVFLSIEVVSGETGEFIDYHFEDEFFQSKEKADKVAAEYRSQIGEVVRQFLFNVESEVKTEVNGVRHLQKKTCVRIILSH